MKFLLLMLMSGFCMLVFAESETQTDWAGGPGVAGPVTNWEDSFYIAGDMDWDTTPGQIKLIVNRNENQIGSADGPAYVIAVDFDGDGDVDVACCAHVSGELFWCENVNGLGTEWTKHLIGNVGSPVFITTADFDSNGYRDLAVSSDSQNEIVLFRNSASGWSSSSVIATNFDAGQIRAGDVDGDGLVDIVGVSDLSGDVCWWRNEGFLSNWPQSYIDGAMMGAYVCDVGDFNKDGYIDVVVASYSQNNIVAYISRSPFGYSWTRYVINSFYDSPISVAVADYNNDGNDDFAVASSYLDGNLHWYDFLDTNNSWISHSIPGASVHNIYDIAARDMDGDGYPEIMAASLGEDKIVWCKNREYLGESWETFAVSSYFYGANGVSVGDVDGDGVQDVLGCAFYGDKISWWRVSGFTSPSILTSSILNIEPPDPGAVIWDYIHWSSTIPAGTAVRFRLKTSYDSLNMGEWSTWITSASSLGALVSQGGQFLQYQAELSTSNPNVTPSLKDISVLWNPVGIEDQGLFPDGQRIWLTSGNPVFGAFSVGYNVEQSGFVSVAVYDVSGRNVSVISHGNMAAGQYTGTVTGLSAGSYAVVMQSDQGFAAKRIVVVR